MEIVYRKFSKEFLDSVIKLEKAWADENITYGLEQSGGDYFLEADNNYFYLALDGNKTIGYVICEKVEKNEYNIFQKERCLFRLTIYTFCSNTGKKELEKIY